MFTITVTGAGYVGISNALVLAKNNTVFITDIDKNRLDMLKKRHSPIADNDIEKFLTNKELKLIPTSDFTDAYAQSDFVVIATPTNYDEKKEYFDTSSVESVIEQIIEVNRNAVIVVKSTIPIGFTAEMCKRYHTEKIIFSPEFLREGRALYDNLYPTRIIMGVCCENKKTDAASTFASLMQQGAEKEDIPTLFLNSTEAEAVKLFANTYLAMRVSFFNEIDSYAETNGLNAKDIIDGVCLDPRVGAHYNNPSFGYGGYCLPKDTRQLLANYENVPQNIIGAIVDANITRKKFVAERLKKRLGSTEGTVGIYRLIMKSGSDNFRQSSILDIIKELVDDGVDVIIYEPSFAEKEFLGCDVIKDFAEFSNRADVIAANRFSKELEECKSKVYTRDAFFRD
ncbi:MAG: nucleotide sugar dehydrogenase [Ruminococcaceae bacterium]|nr:nucleotide sugar dehydrogenase [Oscillospiraceae bacterium]